MEMKRMEQKENEYEIAENNLLNWLKQSNNVIFYQKIDYKVRSNSNVGNKIISCFIIIKDHMDNDKIECINYELSVIDNLRRNKRGFISTCDIETSFNNIEYKLFGKEEHIRFKEILG